MEEKDRRFGDHFVDHYNCSLSYGRKKRKRIRSLNWMTELYGCLEEESDKSFASDESINREVRNAVKKLSLAERQFIELFYFEFKTYQEIARILKKKKHKLERIHQRALGKLRVILADFVKSRFKLEVSHKTDCIICQSPFREELDELIRNKREVETYARLIKLFKQHYGMNIKTPQVIIGHQRKHVV